jgi:signal transduction histidine kinase
MAVDGRLARVGIRLRIAVLAALAVGVALTVGALFLVGLLRSRLDSAATTAAGLRATDIAALASSDALPQTLALPGEESAFVQVIDADGRVVTSSENIEGEPAVIDRRPEGADELTFSAVVRPFHERDRMRIVALNARTSDGVVTVYAGESLERADETTSAISTVLIGGLPFLVILVGFVTWWAVGRTLRSVGAITAAMSEITATDLHRRVPEPRSRDEIGQLARTVNHTLERLDTAVDTQRRFVADASHELRGPLASLRADLEISVTHPGRTQWQIVARDTLTDVERLQHLTDDLLLLARMDARQTRHHEHVDLAAIVVDVAGRVRDEHVAVEVSGAEHSVVVGGDRDQLHRMVRNLVHNAHNHAASRVSVAISTTPSGVILTIGDDGPGIPVDQRRRVFERFVRLDDARTRDAGGTGLGLAIVHDIVSGHHGRIEIGQSDLGGAEFVIRLQVGAVSG